MLMTKSMISISLLDIKEIQDKMLANTIFDVTPYTTYLVEIIDLPKNVQSLTDIETQISQYQFFEHEYKEGYTFYQNLRSMLLFGLLALIFTLVAIPLVIMKRNKPEVQEHWKFNAIFARFWGYTGPNMILRLLHLEFLMVLLAGYVTMRKQLMELVGGNIQNIEMTGEFMMLIVLLLAPFLICLVITFISKETLRKTFVEYSMNTLYHKANLRRFASKGYPFLLLMQRIAVAVVIMAVDNIIIQLGTMILLNMTISWVLLWPSQIYLDKHLQRYERFNQGILVFFQMFLLLFTDFVYSREMQFNFGYFYSLMLGAWCTLSLIFPIIYSLEPISTWIRLRALRLEQIRLAIEFRERLIREAKERKEERKQKKLKMFDDFKIDIGENNETND